MDREFLRGLAVFFGIAAGLCAVCSILVFVLTPIGVLGSDNMAPNRWFIWAAIPATYLTILFGWVANKLVD